MIIDLHAHSSYSNCGRDDMQALVEEMIANGVQVLGITDHNYGICDRRAEYVAKIRELKKRYEGKIELLCGIEICTLKTHGYRSAPDGSFDYCLIENLTSPDSVMEGDIVSFVRNYGCKVGIAHTDLFGFIENTGKNAGEYLKSLADNNIFWELNVNYDSIHGYRQHEYVQRFFESKYQQDAVKEAGLRLSIGFDGHRMEDYLVDRVKTANEFLEKNNILNAYSLITLG